VCNAIFDPGIYYINGDFSAKSNSCLRPSGAPDQAGATDALGGVIFYFTGGGAVNWMFQPAEIAGRPVALKVLLGIRLAMPRRHS